MWGGVKQVFLKKKEVHEGFKKLETLKRVSKLYVLNVFADILR